MKGKKKKKKDKLIKGENEICKIIKNKSRKL